jgi:DNA-binding CsgD family transcriptional regulator
MRLSESTERALEACQDAVLAPELWPVALQSLSDSFGASSTVLLPVDSATTRAPISAEHVEFDALWHRNQAHAPCIFTRKAPCKLGLPYVIEHQIVSPEERERDPYFHETARPGSRDWWAEVCFPVADKQWCLALYRSVELGPFTHEDGRYAALAGSRLSRIVGAAEKFAHRQVSSTLAALERLNSAALVIDSRGVVRGVNNHADALLCDDFRLIAGRPTTRDRASNRRLQDLIAAIRHAERGSVPDYNQVVINRDYRPWLLLEAMPVTSFGSDMFGDGRAVLMLTDLTVPLVTDQTLLAVVFGLTAAEAKMASRIAQGNTIDEAACALGISRETARTQLKAVFLKTSTRRQAELAALLGRLRPIQPRPDA